ncbi:alanine or glycine:cation symporter, AGCS family [Alteribacillus persepolensis]|uniref:Alanine or glycine:cation symporter, AGCS family n=1 Tax=Alteribacillus persepolensis TaxID=568899 RepID=A0A1G8F3Z2_9BACI|nr:sodium:alanine symporter family protein [Alteribacillus persepolensis]SDH76826.1 alanine or glycine:cation symporter, AGCS family [Alteribacillus persepolensis]
MERLIELNAKIADMLAVPLMIFLIGGGIFLTIKLRFFQFKHFPHMMTFTFRTMFKKGDGEGTVTPFQAVAGAMASTIGAANIIGVPVAIAFGGPGAVFWMWLIALIGMATKYSEVVLGVKYRTVNKAGAYVGGPMYYIDKGLGWKWLAVLLAGAQLFVVFSSASVQANSLAGVLEGSFQIPSIVTGIVVSVLIILVMAGGIKTIGTFAERAVPSMVLVYMGAAIIVLLFHIDAVPHAFYLIFQHAFAPISAVGGFAGAALAAVIRWGVARGLYSNEAGMGSAAIAHAGAQNKNPATQGFWGVFEVFIDTMVVCTITALVILTTDVWTAVGPDRAENMTMLALAEVFGQSAAGLIISVTLFVFALTTMLMVIYFGEKQAEYLFGYKASIVFRYVFISSILVGAASNLLFVWSLLDIAMVFVVVPNMIAVMLLSGKVKEITRSYFSKKQDHGENHKTNKHMEQL